MTVIDSVQQPSAATRTPRAAATPAQRHLADRPAAAGEFDGLSAGAHPAEVVRVSRELAIDAFRGADVATATARLEEIAGRWANHGIPLDRLQQAVHEGFRVGTDRAAGPAAPADVAAAMTILRRQLDVLQSLHVALTRAYTRQLPMPADPRHAAGRRLAVALLRGEPTGPLSRHTGLEVAEGYHVVAVGLPARADGGPGSVAPLAVQCVDSELDRRFGSAAVSFLGVDGGTLLLPEDLVEDGALDELVAVLSRCTGARLLAVVLRADAADIPVVARQAHELLETAVSLRATPRLYRIDDLGLPFQLTRPGPGRDALDALLAPLDDKPELLRTLTCHLANDLNRRLTARQLRVHANTIDYRLKRIGLLTGCDPTEPTGLWQLRSALIVRRFTDGSTKRAAATQASGS
ncbi:PucR family transcriptional regulator [Nocardia blacklockiae]|uniref:PucR family transcriptional regulator n=1 Tax=Nocardia blacklockiae TaxID=480036 RepID=UPI0018947E5C|nr:helix-turn-helix domain-containing protein [Nocardia blacklockiae]MBF6175832.1 helix-turn-helix domain-containing protein [Nocardia blacklockiae]